MVKPITCWILAGHGMGLVAAAPRRHPPGDISHGGRVLPALLGPPGVTGATNRSGPGMRRSRTRNAAGGLISVPPTALDTIHWYMYLAENFLTSVAKYKPTHGARILLQPLRTKQPPSSDQRRAAHRHRDTHSALGAGGAAVALTSPAFTSAARPSASRDRAHRMTRTPRNRSSSVLPVTPPP